MTDDLVRLMNRLFLPGARALGGSCWRPAADVYQTPSGWLLKLDLAGVRPEDVEVARVDGRLCVRGCRRDWLVEESHRHYHMEIAYSRFERWFDLPCDLARCTIDTEDRHGMLVIRIHLEETPS